MYIIVNTRGVVLEQKAQKNRQDRLSNFMHILTAENPLTIQKYSFPSKPKHSLTLPTLFSSKHSPFPPSPNSTVPSIPHLPKTLIPLTT